MTSVPEIRIHALNGASADRSREFVLYWMIGNRRMEWSFSLYVIAQVLLPPTDEDDKKVSAASGPRTTYRTVSVRPCN